ncbi:MAG: NAD+ synthase [Bdellovibrionales bacterium]
MLSLTLAQINPTLGDVAGNSRIIFDVWQNLEQDGEVLATSQAALCVFPELALTGYPPEDLILNANFINKIEADVESLCQKSKSFMTAALITCPWRIDGHVYNAALLIYDGVIQSVTAKHHLPNYGVFDEKRVFKAGPLPNVIDFKGVKLGVMICEDMWHSDVALHLKNQGADILIVPNGSPWRIGKEAVRFDHAYKRVQETGLALVYINQVGGQDELIFDGGSFVMNPDGRIASANAPFFESFDIFDFIKNDDDILTLKGKTSSPPETTDHQSMSHLYDALVLGLKNYVIKNGFSQVVLGLSGGIDSALCAAIAVDALGKENVRCVMLPSPFTSQDSLDDAKTCANALGASYEIFEIHDAMKAFEGIIPDLDGIAHENMQSRCRGVILMALSNQSGAMLLTTGNKSEMAVGYATLYGDMNGGFNPLKDVYKMQVYALAEARNTLYGDVIPDRILTKAPSAELREDQTDQDSLPEYDVLDDILKGLIENEDSLEDIAARGHDLETIKKIAHLLRINEYKRYQAPPGTKVTTRAFGRDRRYPMTNKYRFD